MSTEKCPILHLLVMMTRLQGYSENDASKTMHKASESDVTAVADSHLFIYFKPELVI